MDVVALPYKKVNVLETVFHMADNSQPGRAGTRPWLVVLLKYTPDNIFIDAYTECFVDLLRYSGTAKPRVTPFQFDDGIDEFL